MKGARGPGLLPGVKQKNETTSKYTLNLGIPAGGTVHNAGRFFVMLWLSGGDRLNRKNCMVEMAIMNLDIAQQRRVKKCFSVVCAVLPVASQCMFPQVCAAHGATLFASASSRPCLFDCFLAGHAYCIVAHRIRHITILASVCFCTPLQWICELHGVPRRFRLPEPCRSAHRLR